MKIRNGFVSNSSSSSFIVVGKEPPCNNYKLTPEQAKYVAKKYDFPIKDGSELYLTEYFSDGSESDGGLLDDYELHSYLDGNHGRPYGTWKGEGCAYEGFVIVAEPMEAFYFLAEPCCDAVWMLEEDYNCQEKTNED